MSDIRTEIDAVVAKKFARGQTIFAPLTDAEWELVKAGEHGGSKRLKLAVMRRHHATMRASGRFAR